MVITANIYAGSYMLSNISFGFSSGILATGEKIVLSHPQMLNDLVLDDLGIIDGTGTGFIYELSDFL